MDNDDEPKSCPPVIFPDSGNWHPYTFSICRVLTDISTSFEIIFRNNPTYRIDD